MKKRIAVILGHFLMDWPTPIQASLPRSESRQNKLCQLKPALFNKERVQAFSDLKKRISQAMTACRILKGGGSGAAVIMFRANQAVDLPNKQKLERGAIYVAKIDFNALDRKDRVAAGAEGANKIGRAHV